MKEVRGENYYDDKVWATERIFKKVESLIPFKYGTALDLGCGQGNLSKMIHSKGYSILGVDIENFLKFDDIEFKKRDLDNNWDLKDKFDLVIATELIEHLENPRHFFRELKKVLKEGGIGIITTPNIAQWKARLNFLLRGKIWGFRNVDYKLSGHITPLSRYDFKRICKEVGLKIIKITYNNSNI